MGVVNETNATVQRFALPPFSRLTHRSAGRTPDYSKVGSIPRPQVRASSHRVLRMTFLVSMSEWRGRFEIGKMSLILNILWMVFGGVWMAAGWLLAAIIMGVTIIGIPWASAAANIALYTLLPFGHTAIDREEFTGNPSVGSGPLGLVGNLVWLLLAGWWLALGHLITAVGLAITIIGLPFAWAHLKLAGLALWPIGKEIVSVEAAERSLRFRSPAQRL